MSTHSIPLQWVLQLGINCLINHSFNYIFILTSLKIHSLYHIKNLHLFISYSLYITIISLVTLPRHYNKEINIQRSSVPATFYCIKQQCVLPLGVFKLNIFFALMNSIAPYCQRRCMLSSYLLLMRMCQMKIIIGTYPCEYEMGEM